MLNRQYYIILIAVIIFTVSINRCVFGQSQSDKSVYLEPGEKKRVDFTLTPDDLSMLDINLKPVVEPGRFDVMVGSSSKDIRLKGSFRVKD